ncbi:MAG: Uma2 family endonuclease [Saprospiraceae bacterium]|jgi:Uma2 family endonuclease|nr:Uma2 family endonuclease [Lewinellaceae bacterium]
MDSTFAPSSYEIERGKPLPSKNHAIIQANLLLAIQPKYASKFRMLPEINLDLPEHDRVPDLAIYASVEFTPGADEVRMTEVPLSVIEILSPQQSMTDLMVKRGEYFKAGVQSYWLVLPDLLSIYVFYSPEEYDVYTRQDLLKDKTLEIEVPLGEIFK